MQRSFSQILRVVAVTSLLGAFFGSLHLFNPGHEWEEATVDLRLRHRPKILAPEDVGLVIVGDDDVANPQFGVWPFRRAVHADVIQILRALGAKHIIFDILFVESTEEGDDIALASAILEKNDITLAYHFDFFQATGSESMSVHLRL
jgi:CHASE2 domain-containing sensor protein